MKRNIAIVLFLSYLNSMSVFAHSGHVHEEAIAACEQQLPGDACSYILNKSKRYVGNCQIFNAALLCVRNQPIESVSAEKPKEADKLDATQPPLNIK